MSIWLSAQAVQPVICTVWHVGVTGLTPQSRQEGEHHLRVQGLRGATLPVACTVEPLLTALLALSLFRFIIPAIDVAPHQGH